jgi:predicted nucleic acid-binding protein
LILTDANVLMYAAGAARPNEAPAIAFLDRVANNQITASVDAEVLQEIAPPVPGLEPMGGRAACL